MGSRGVILCTPSPAWCCIVPSAGDLQVTGTVLCHPVTGSGARISAVCCSVVPVGDFRKETQFVCCFRSLSFKIVLAFSPSLHGEEADGCVGAHLQVALFCT